MKIRKVNNFPWYQELVPLAALVLVAVGVSFTWSHLGESIPVHFNRHGQVDDYASPVMFIGGMLLFMTLFIIIDAAFRYNWLLQERERKRFNYAQLIYNVIIVFLSWITVRVLLFGAGFIQRFDMDLATGGPVILVGLLVLILSEIARPLAIVDRAASEPGASTSTTKIIGKHAHFYYSQSSNPWWLKAVTVVGGLGALVGAYDLLRHSEMLLLQIVGVLLVCLSPVLLLGVGGFRFVASGRGATVRIGWLGIPLMQLPLEKIASMELVNFSALQDFGGYGVRCGKDNTKAYILKGDSGVKLVASDSNYVLGCPNPEEFLAVLQEAKAKVN